MKHYSTKGKSQTAVVINDLQIPYQDSTALALAETLIKKVSPDILIYNGDIADFYQISKFDKNPDRVGKLEDDIRSVRTMFNYHRMMLGSDVRMFLLEGNHEFRFQKFLWSKAPELSSLECLTVPELFKLKDFDIKLIPYEEGLMINNIFLVLHGNISSIHSGYTAKRMFEKHGGCGICGHSHRGGSFYKRDRFGIWGWWENFCLCDLEPDYIQHPNWNHGLSIVHFTPKRFWVEQVPIVNNKLMYGGTLYE